MAETISMPKLGFDMQEGTLIRWVKNEGEQISKGDVLAEIETDKATVEVESSAGGTIRKLLVDQGAVVPIGAPIAIVGSPDEKIDAPEKEAGETQKKEVKGKKAEGRGAKSEEEPSGMKEGQAPGPMPEALSESDAGLVKASPLAKKLASDSKVDLSQVQGTGPGGRIVRRDIEGALTKGESLNVKRSTVLSADMPVSREDQTVQLTKLRQIIARRMTDSKTSAPHFYVTHEYKMDRLMALRSELNGYVRAEEKLSVNDFIVKAAAMSLREFPNLNASFAGDKVIRHGEVNVGVAVAVENGLMTVVSRAADQKPLRQIALEIKSLAARAREGKVRPEDIEGSTFSVSNMGMYDVENFAAILNPPEAAILAVGSAREIPVIGNGAITIGWRMKATISVDHRVSDGVEAARFMQALAKYLEEPLRLMI